MAPDGSHTPLSAKLNFPATNNVAEYEACILGLEALLAIEVREVDVYRDSALIISQAQKIWKTKEEHLKPFQAYVEKLAQRFDKIEYTFIPQAQNKFADAFATLASLVDIPENQEDLQDGFLLDYAGSRLCRLCMKVSSMSSACKFEPYLSEGTLQYDIPLAFLNLVD